MTEIERLRADLETLQECQKIHMKHSMNYSPYTAHVIQAIEEKIAELEAEAADSWAHAKAAAIKAEKNMPLTQYYEKQLARYVRHLESENAAKDSRIAELEAREVPPLDPKRVIRTAMNFMACNSCPYRDWNDVEPYPLQEPK